MCWLKFQENFWRNQLSEAQACAALVSRNPTAFWLACKPFHDRITSPYMAASGCWMDWAGIYPERFQFVGTGWQKLNSEFFSICNIRILEKGLLQGLLWIGLRLGRERTIFCPVFFTMSVYEQKLREIPNMASAAVARNAAKKAAPPRLSVLVGKWGANNRPNLRSFVGRVKPVLLKKHSYFTRTLSSIQVVFDILLDFALRSALYKGF